MAIASQTYQTPAGQVDLRVWGYTRNAILPGVMDHVFSKSPTSAIFLGQMLGDFGATGMSGVGHTSQTGGHAVEIRVELGKHSGTKRKAGPFDTHNTAPDDNTRFAEANWKFYSGPLTISNHDRRVNQGDAAISSFVAHQTTQVMRSVADEMTGDIHSTAQVTDACAPLNVLIGANESSIQGLNAQTFGNYNSRGVSARGTAVGSISFASGSFAAQGISDMRTCFNGASEGTVQPNVILTDYATHERYEGSLQPQERFTGAVAVADGSFKALAFRTVPVMADPKTASGYLYMVRAGEGGVRMIALSGADFEFDDFKMAGEQSVAVSELEATMQLVIENRAHGSNKLTGITD